MRLILGIDGGGTSCRAALATVDGTVLGQGKSGPANILTDLGRACDSIVNAARLAFADAGLDPAGIETAGAVLGLAGTETGTQKAELIARLPFRESVVESDAAIALHGALGPHDGAIAILGTGSIFVARRAGKLNRIGGWGFRIGDLGGGARLGRDLLEEALLAYDGIHPASPMTDAVLERFDRTPGKVVAFAATAHPVDYGTFAPLVFEFAAREDPVALRLIARSVTQIEEALDVLRLGAGERLCLLGGLAALYAPFLSPRYQALVHPPLQDALAGAVAMAAARFGGSEAA